MLILYWIKEDQHKVEYEAMLKHKIHFDVVVTTCLQQRYELRCLCLNTLLQTNGYSSLFNKPYILYNKSMGEGFMVGFTLRTFLLLTSFFKIQKVFFATYIRHRCLKYFIFQMSRRRIPWHLKESVPSP